ncbi:ABC transporter permease [Paenibacillus agricola]|uniref:Sugar ABC transporter permease n=1 Tax=Paenibacillus agricola TaxID=2716264 RepID=A0ABX0J4E9_9BACL|nr:sugar ABC transporter permease [Paenibacillus agricola]
MTGNITELEEKRLSKEAAALVQARKDVYPKRSKVWRTLSKDRWMYMMLVPGLFYFLIFKYLPIGGLAIAFQNYQPFLGFTESKWVGFHHFIRFFNESDFWLLLKNTTIIGVSNIVFFFPLPILLALMLNEVRHLAVKRFVQTVTYVPHFMSWVVVVSISYILFTTEGGVVNDVIASIWGQKLNILANPDWFLPLYIGQVIWKECGWGTIIFLAALTSIDPEQYEAARIDGARRLQQLWYITLPMLRSTIVILLILRLGSFFDTGFEHIYSMQNALNRNVSEVFDTYVYMVGITQGSLSYSTAVGMFTSIVGLILVYLSNRVSKKLGEEGIF